VQLLLHQDVNHPNTDKMEDVFKNAVLDSMLILLTEFVHHVQAIVLHVSTTISVSLVLQDSKIQMELVFKELHAQ